MNYYIVRAQWGQEDMSDEFVDEGKWINGYGENKYSLTVDMIVPGDVLILARQNQEIYCIGRCKKNEKDFKTIQVNWFPGFHPIQVGEIINPYSRTINRLRSDDFFNSIKTELFQQNPGLETFLLEDMPVQLPERIKISKIRLAWFKFFGKEMELRLDGKNMLLYGENGSGKTSLSDALKYMTSTSIADGEPPNNNINIFAKENDKVRIELELDNGELFFVDESVNLDALRHSSILHSIAFINPFITYKDILQIYFKEFDQQGSRNLFDFFKAILKDYPIDTHKRLKDLNGEQYFNKLRELVQDLKELANQFLDEFNENIRIEGFQFDIYNHAITINLKFREQDVKAYQTFFNEAKLTALGLSVYFASIIKKYSIFNTEFKILVLDDLLISLDMNHRKAVLEILTKNHFENFQKIIMTHERGFFNLFKNQLNKYEWIFFELYEKEDVEKGCSFPYLIPSLDFLERAKKAFQEMEYENCANLLRKAAEDIANEFIGTAVNRNGQHIILKDLLNMMKGQINQKQHLSDDIKNQLSDIITKIQQFRDAILNPFSHANKESPLYKKELIDALELIEGFKAAVDRI